MNIAVIGTGYVGLTTGACLAQIGHNVICVDIDEEKIENLKHGNIPIYEPGLEELVKKNIKGKRLSFTIDSAQAMQKSSIVFSAVGTPLGKNSKADIQYVESVARKFGQTIDSYTIFVNKSTVPLGTAEMCRNIISKEIKKRKSNAGFSIISNPEFLKEGTAIKDSLNPERIVIGYDDDTARDIMQKVYQPILNSTNAIFMPTDIKSAELIKYASNAFLATKISFINEISQLCELTGADIDLIAEGMGYDSRIGTKFLKAGVGYGGSCFPKDISALIHTGKEFGYEFQILDAVERVNSIQKTHLLTMLGQDIGKLEGKTIAIWGASFKADTDDVRDAPSLDVIDALLKEGAIIKLHDPIATENIKKYFPALEVRDDKYEVLEEATALLILTDWDEYKSIDEEAILTKMILPFIYDGRRVIKRINNPQIRLRRIGDTRKSY